MFVRTLLVSLLWVLYCLQGPEVTSDELQRLGLNAHISKIVVRLCLKMVGRIYSKIVVRIRPKRLCSPVHRYIMSRRGLKSCSKKGNKIENISIKRH